MSRKLTASDRRSLIRLASTLPAGSEERKAILAGLSLIASGYARKSMRAGDYAGAGSSKQLVKDMIANMRRVKTDAERSHAVEQVQYAEAAKSITSQQAKEVMEAIGKTASKGLEKSAGNHPLLRKVEGILEGEYLFEGEDWDVSEMYVGRGMVGLPGTSDRVSPLAISVRSRYHGPRSDLGKKMNALGFAVDNMGMGWIYYLR